MTVSGLTASTPNPFNFTVNGTSGSQTATLSMTLLLEDYTLTVTPPLAQIVSGGSANYTLTLTPSNGFNQQVNLSCSSTNFPAGAACKFGSTSVTPGGSPVKVNLIVTTTISKTGTGPRGWPFGSAPPRLGLWLMGMGLLASLLLLRNRNRAPSLAILGCVLLLALLLGGCRSGNFAPAGTPSGNYTITLNGTLNSNTAVVRTVNFNLSVTPTP